METTRHKVATRTRPGTGSPRVPWIEGACRKCATTTSAARTQFIEQEPAPAQSLSIAHTSRVALRHNGCADHQESHTSASRTTVRMGQSLITSCTGLHAAHDAHTILML